jgi:rhodanese-related sulfurtransferase
MRTKKPGIERHRQFPFSVSIQQAVMQTLTPEQLHDMLRTPENLRLIDVREPEEHAEFNLGGTLIPLNEIVARMGELPRELPVVLYCRKGIRSALAIQRLRDKHPFANLFNLAGGTEAWKRRFPDKSE